LASLTLRDTRLRSCGQDILRCRAVREHRIPRKRDVRVFRRGRDISSRLCARYLLKKPSIAPYSLLFLAFSPAYWRLSQVSEMYSLNAFLCAAIILIVLKALAEPRTEKLTLISGFLSPGFSRRPRGREPPDRNFSFSRNTVGFWRFTKVGINGYLSAALFFFAGLSVYLFLPVRSFTGPFRLGGPETMRGLWRVMTRADYGGMRLHPQQSEFYWTFGLVLRHLLVYAQSLISQSRS